MPLHAHRRLATADRTCHPLHRQPTGGSLQPSLAGPARFRQDRWSREPLPL